MRSDDKGYDWYCDECNAYIITNPASQPQRRVDVYWCGCVNDVTEDNVRCDDDEEYGGSVIDEINDVSEGCRTCGGPYPNCNDSCPLFDD